MCFKFILLSVSGLAKILALFWVIMTVGSCPYGSVFIISPVNFLSIVNFAKIVSSQAIKNSFVIHGQVSTAIFVMRFE